MRVIENGKVRDALFLDLQKLTRSGGERGLIGLTFDPGYKINRRIYVHYSDLNGDTVLARYTATSDFSRADAGSAKTLFTAKQPYSNHNGGQIAFGPDGFLYLGLGDGGSGMLRFFTRGTPSALILDTPAVITSNTWYFVAAVADVITKTKRLYVYSSSGSALAAVSSSWTEPSFGSDSGIASAGG